MISFTYFVIELPISYNPILIKCGTMFTTHKENLQYVLHIFYIY
jgi:hypothetical protein